ncbi:hypothetical protein OHA25_17205 [Nonomuraea sp. NBC_00507]|uniref:hypothetical protein n=1 Tax=Nonomuraea sp. NBC_00507 TaxID=2976002 RepID=UPI002E175300
MKESAARVASLLTCILVLISACQQDKTPVVDTAPLPSAPAPPYLCDHIPEAAAKLMTGVSNPIVVGFLTEPRTEAGYGTCATYQPTGERARLLRVILDAGGVRGQVDEYLKDGGKLLPEIVPGGYGAYIKDPDEESHVGAILVKGKARLLVELARGVKGRDNAADMVAFMKLIAPRLLIGTDTPSPSPSRGKGS